MNKHTNPIESCELCKKAKVDHNMFALKDLIRLAYFVGGFWFGLIGFIFMMVLNGTNR